MKKSLLRSFALLGLCVLVVFAFACKGKDKGNKGGDEVCQHVDANKDGKCDKCQADLGGGGGSDTTYTVTYVLNEGSWAAEDVDKVPTSYDGKKNVALRTPVREGYKFGGWFDNKDFNGESITKINKGDSGNKTFYAKWTESHSGSYQPKWNLNTSGFDGGGMKILIKVLPTSSYDPFLTEYTGDSKEILQNHQNLVQSAYGVQIVYSAWDNEAPWGPERVNFIKNSFTDKSFLNKNVFVVNIDSQWIPTLVKADCLAELYNMGTESGIFADLGYEQDSTINEACAVNKKVYGYSYGFARPDYFLYYNYTLAQKINMEDPAEIYFKGEWTWSKFEEWCAQAQKNLAADENAIDAGYAPFSIGAIAAQGNKMVNAKTGTLLLTKQSVTSVFDSMQKFYQNGIWDKAHGVQDVAARFVAGKTIFQDGSIWYLADTTRFTPYNEETGEGCNFVVGVVPYPMANDSVATPITAPYTYYDTENNEVEVNEPIMKPNGEVLKDAGGNSIYGIDLSESTFKIPYTGTGCYSIMNFNSGSVTPANIAAILHDLLGAVGPDPDKDKLTSDEGYRVFLEKKLDFAIHQEVIMSCQDSSLMYYDLMQVLSMTVGDGSHFGPNAYWPLASGIVSGTDTAATKFKEVEDVYAQALEFLGY